MQKCINKGVSVVENFTYDELRMIKWAVATEIRKRAEEPLVCPERLAKFEDLYDKVFDMIQDMKNNN